MGIKWHDPYAELGGLGASSAQFISVYRALHDIYSKSYSIQKIFRDYLDVAWSGQGLKPSGYDVLAQSMYGCVYLEKHQISTSPYSWCFSELAFIIFHTGQKLATHKHLASITLPKSMSSLTRSVELAHMAFQTANSEQLIRSITTYHHNLLDLNLVAPHTQQILQALQTNPQILAMKGCGAMGADLICILMEKQHFSDLYHEIPQRYGKIMATHLDLTENATTHALQEKCLT